MYKKSKKLVVWCLVVSMVLTQMLFTNAAFAATSAATRLAGADRYQTAIEISKAGFTASENAVVAYGEDFPDALTAAPLAQKYNAPILLTDKAGLSNGVLAELQRLGVKNVFVVGGEGVVSKSVADALTAANMTVERLSGADRYATALAVANKIGTTSEVVVAYGEGFADALSISSIAASKGMPILLTDTNSMSDAVKAYIGSKKAYVVGGTGVVSDSVFNSLTGAVRLGGVDRYATNVAVMTQFAADLNFGKVILAYGENFPDALAGSVYAAKLGSPLVLTYTNLMDVTKTFLNGKVKADVQVIALGGSAVVSEAAAAAVAPSVVVPSALQVESISSVGLNAVQVVFNQPVDKTSAIATSNYLFDGAPITGTASLASDNKTLLLMFDTSKPQYSKVLFTVKDKAVLSKDTLTSVPKAEQQIQFSDVAVPEVKSVSVTGNTKLTVEFNEPVSMNQSFLDQVGSLLKIDGQNLTTYGYSTATVTAATSSNAFGTKLEVKFAVAVPAGNHTLKVAKGVSGSYLYDGAGFLAAETEKAFTVEAITSAPQVVSVTGEDNGIVYVTYNRAMDAAAATTATYSLNTDAVKPTGAEFVSGSGDTKVKLTFVKTDVKTDSNILIVAKDTKDAFGNKLDANNNVRATFTATKDTTKPTVVSVVIINKNTVRVKYSEIVDDNYAKQTSNYSLKDSTGATINITGAVSSKGTGNNSDTYTLTTADITGANNTLKVKNIVDISVSQNLMDEYVATISSTDDIKPSLSQVVMVDSTKVAVFFSESMDAATITDKANYAYYDDASAAVVHSLPSSAEITTGNNNKYVVITFPAGYSVTATALASGNANVATQIRVSNVKDASGNILDKISDYKVIETGSAAGSRPAYVEKSFKLYADGSSNVKAEFELDRPISTLEVKDFVITDKTTTITASTGYISGNKIVLSITGNDATTVKGFGVDAYLATTDSTIKSADAAKITIKPITTATVVYDDQIAPKLVSADVYATTGTAGAAQLTLVFTEAIDNSLAGSYVNDFKVYVDGKENKIVSANATNSKVNTVTFTLTDAVTSSSNVVVKALATTSANYSSIKDIKDVYGDQNVYAPTTDDINGYVVSDLR